MLGVEETFAGYVIDGVLGQGGMGTVYRARHPRLPRMVALKLLNQDVSADEELRRRFEQEANVVARLDHPGIVGIYDRGVQDGHLWISMQYIRGSDADQLDGRAVAPERLLGFITDTAKALDYAHSQGVLHRDVKPANILLAEGDGGLEERALLTDFGIARLLESDSKLTATGTFTATLAYASPEQLSGEPLDHLADQYSLACTLFTLLAGHAPFTATNPGQVIAGHLSKPVPRLTVSRPDLPQALDDVIARAMAKRREDRFASCGDFAAAATDALRGAPTMVWAKAEPTVLLDQPTEQLAHGRGTPPQPWAPQPQQWGQQQWRPQPGGMWPQPPGLPRPTRFTAVAASVLAILCGLPAAFYSLGLSIMLATGEMDNEGDAPEMLAVAAICAALTGLFLVGAGFLLAGRPGGRVAVAVGFGLTAGLAMLMAGIIGADGYPGPALIVGAIGLALSGIGLGCALARQTKHWIEYRQYLRRYR
ncbi:serine/threonine-protein kinase [Nocardia sp. NPDC051832]|uniref:serine/threonine-protein kinase n=1 Tax=Nocardia sp. NPDC051832 TaxID=3155673 RepID=UPI00341B4387